MFNPSNILVTTDFSRESDAALMEAADIAEKFGSTLHLLHVLNEVEQCAVDYCIREEDVEAAKLKLSEDTKKRMDDEIRRILNNRLIPIVEDVRFGSTIDEILKEEREKDIDLVVTAPHRSRKNWRKVFPHLVDKILRKSPIETMIVKRTLH